MPPRPHCFGRCAAPIADSGTSASVQQHLTGPAVASRVLPRNSAWGCTHLAPIAGALPCGPGWVGQLAKYCVRCQKTAELVQPAARHWPPRARSWDRRKAQQQRGSHPFRGRSLGCGKSSRSAAGTSPRTTADCLLSIGNAALRRTAAGRNCAPVQRQRVRHRRRQTRCTIRTTDTVSLVDQNVSTGACSVV